MKNKNNFTRVYDVVRKIPEGKVASYGQIARLLTEELKNPSSSLRTSYKIKRQITPRVVGFALHANKDPEIPCHRVVNKDGKVAENYVFEGWREQKRRLQAEGVVFLNEREVDLERHLWKGRLCCKKWGIY